MRENDAGWAPGFDDLTSRCQLAGLLINPEGHDVVAVEVCGIKQAARGVEGEEARGTALRRFPADRRQHSVRRVHAENHDAVVPAVRHEDVIPRRSDLYFGGG